MRIAYLTQSYPPMISGAALFAEQLAQAMALQGHQVLVIAASDQNDPYTVNKDNLTILRLGSIHNPLRVGQRFLLYPRRAIMKALHEFQPDAIHAHEPLLIGLLGAEYAKQVHVPSLLSIHQLPAFVTSYLPVSLRSHAESILWRYAHWLCRQFTRIITPTQTISTVVTEITGLPTNTIGYGIDPRLFHPPLPGNDEAGTRQKWNLPSGVPLLLHVGRLDTDKRVDRVVYAAAQSMRTSNAHLLIVGDGTQKPALMKLCHSLGIADRVHFLGFISMKDGLPEIYRLAHLFVMASEIETQGIVLLEAAASGLPMVAIRATCIPEIVHEGKNGYLAPSGDWNGLSKAMDLLLSNPEKAKLIGQASLTLAAAYVEAHTHRAYERLYGQLINPVRIEGGTRKTNLHHGVWKRVKSWAHLG